MRIEDVFWSGVYSWQYSVAMPLLSGWGSSQVMLGNCVVLCMELSFVSSKAYALVLGFNPTLKEALMHFWFYKVMKWSLLGQGPCLTVTFTGPSYPPNNVNPAPLENLPYTSISAWLQGGKRDWILQSDRYRHKSGFSHLWTDLN